MKQESNRQTNGVRPTLGDMFARLFETKCPKDRDIDFNFGNARIQGTLYNLDNGKQVVVSKDLVANIHWDENNQIVIDSFELRSASQLFKNGSHQND